MENKEIQEIHAYVQEQKKEKIRSDREDRDFIIFLFGAILTALAFGVGYLLDKVLN